MKKEQFIVKFGEERYEKLKKKILAWRRMHPIEVLEQNANHRRDSLKGGKYYPGRKRYNSTGLRGRRGQIRSLHCYHYHSYKQIIAPESQLHHEWIPGTADYRGIALVEKDQHMHGYIDVIQIIEGKITLLTEERIRREGK